MTSAAYLSDRGNPQLARQAAQEETWRREPFEPDVIKLSSSTQNKQDGGPPAMYLKFCAQCHGQRGEGARVGVVNFPPLIGVAAKPRRTVADIVNLLKDPAVYGLQPPMRSFADKLTEEQMTEIAEFVVTLK